MVGDREPGSRAVPVEEWLALLMPWLERDSVALFDEEAPGGSRPLVLVHGVGCDHSFMAPQFDAFRGTHRVVTVDLRGHGRSDKPQQNYTIGGFAGDLPWSLRELALAPPVIIGHSMGGAIALELAAREPERLAGVVLLDSAVMPSPKVWAGVQPVLAALKAPGYKETMRRFFAEAFFLPTDDAERKAAIVDAMLATPHHVLASAFEGIFAWDSAAAAARCRVPTLYVASTRPRGDVTRFAEACPTLVHGQVVGSGHFLQLEVPDQVNAMIRRFLAIGVPPASAPTSAPTSST
jgi:pimeloyl-ACP methyl ester carboxylesterase